MSAELHPPLDNQQAHSGVISIRYVGLPLVAEFARAKCGLQISVQLLVDATRHLAREHVASQGFAQLLHPLRLRRREIVQLEWI